MVDDDQICPHCGYVLIDLAGYDPHESGAETVLGGFRGPEAEGLFAGAYKWITASAKQKRLDAILSEYPASLYCAQCGYLLKRT